MVPGIARVKRLSTVPQTLAGRTNPMTRGDATITAYRDGPFECAAR